MGVTPAVWHALGNRYKYPRARENILPAQLLVKAQEIVIIFIITHIWEGDNLV